VTPDGVDLVDKKNAGRVLLALIEEVANPRRAHSDKHLDKVGAAHREERHRSLACNCFSEKGFPRSRWAQQQGALGNPAPELLELLGIAQEFDDLLELFFGFLHSSYILECHLLLNARE